MIVFFDTMVYLHYRSVEEINLDEFLGPPPHTIIVPRISLRELDKHKNSHRLSRIRARAKKVLINIEQWASGEPVRPGVAMEFMSAFPTLDFNSLGLNRDWADDILIASIFEYKKNHPGDSEAILITQDSGPRLTALQLGLKVFELPEKYKLPTEQDPLEAENQELHRTISSLQNAMPKLCISFGGSDLPEEHARFSLSQPPKPIGSEIEKKIEDLKAKFPKLHPSKSRPPAQDSPFAQLQAQLPSLSNFTSILPEEYERYNREVDEYLCSFKSYLEESWETLAAKMRSIQFEIEIRNTGTAPAEDIDVYLHFPDGFELYTLDNLPENPKEPLPPRKPRTPSQQMSDNMRIVNNLNYAYPTMRDFTLPSSFSIERTKSFDVRDQFDRIKHGDTVTLPHMVLTFDSFQSAKSFSCDYTIRPANLPFSIKGKLHFVIEKEEEE